MGSKKVAALVETSLPFLLSPGVEFEENNLPITGVLQEGHLLEGVCGLALRRIL